MRTLTAANQSISDLEAALAAAVDQHPDGEILRSLSGFAPILAARVLSEFRDDPTRFADPASGRAYAGTAPITRASGRTRVVLARHVRNTRLADACYRWAFAALTRSPGARAYYDTRRAARRPADPPQRRAPPPPSPVPHRIISTTLPPAWRSRPRSVR